MTEQIYLIAAAECGGGPYEYEFSEGWFYTDDLEEAQYCCAELNASSSYPQYEVLTVHRAGGDKWDRALDRHPLVELDI